MVKKVNNLEAFPSQMMLVQIFAARKEQIQKVPDALLAF